MKCGERKQLWLLCKKSGLCNFSLSQNTSSSQRVLYQRVLFQMKLKLQKDISFLILESDNVSWKPTPGTWWFGNIMSVEAKWHFKFIFPCLSPKNIHSMRVCPNSLPPGRSNKWPLGVRQDIHVSSWSIHKFLTEFSFSEFCLF